MFTLLALRYPGGVYSTTQDDILACFRLLLGREPHEEERSGHFSMVGKPLDLVVSSYLKSLEFRNRGLLAPSIETVLVTLDDFAVCVAADDLLIAPAIREGCYEPEATRAFLGSAAKARSLLALQASLDQALVTVTPQTIEACFRHCGYGS